MGVFDCSSCVSFCCVVPPMLCDEHEVEKAQGLGVRVIATAMEGGYYCSVTKNESGVCPFVVKGRGCGIYGDNFKACKDFKCGAIGKSVSEIISLDSMDFYDAFTVPLAPLDKPELFSLEYVQKRGIEVVSREEALKLVNISEFSDVALLTFDLVKKLTQLHKKEK